MADVDAYLPLAAEFPPVSVDDWLTLVGDITRLRTATYDGITIEPLYTAADEVPAAGLPGQFPFVRGRTARGARQGWDVRQLVDVRWGQRAAVAELERGATSVWLRWSADDPVDPASLAGVLDDVLFDVAPVVLDGGHRWVEAARAMRPLWERAAVDPASLAGSLGADPFGDWAVRRDDDRLAADLTALVAEAGPLVAEYPNLRVATIDATRFHDAGASDAEELGIGLAGVVATWRTLTEGGLDVEAAMARLELRLATTVDQFASIAKFRAARQVLARVAEVAGHPTAGSLVPLHAVTSRAMTTRYDAAVNIVRSTVACFAAAVGGADAITVLPHDTFVAAPPSERARRLARNTQAVLALESNVTSVIDAAGGSWYVERLTEHLAERAWDVFQEIESADGFRRAVESGLVDGLVAATRAARRADIDHLRAPIVGVSAFPGLDRLAVSDAEVLGEQVPRWASGFETLRTRVDAAVSTGARRPAVFLARLGSPAASAGRATAAAAFFGIAGLDSVGGPPTVDAAAVAEAFAASGTSVACVCSGGDVDQGRLDELADALATAGATRVYSADELPGDARHALADLLDHLAVHQ